ncbi:MAG: IMPACT family protein [Ignavibacteria bacterium]|nr:IMPACT family protein [Ignavibacteria bacterium]
MKDEFTTINARLRKETKVRGSRFVATAIPASTRDEAEEFVHHIHREFHDATHHCYAYRTGFEGAGFRFNDDGEPSGTAGKPILAAIDKFGLTDVLVVVTRWFGGTRLGVGGLTRAYYGAAERTLSNAERVVRFITDTFEVTFPHAYIGNVMHIVSREGAKISDTRYDEDVHITMEIRRSGHDRLRDALIAQTSGNIDVKHANRS